jgi:5-methylcytosine-specific restriction endonuclease McrA
VTTARHRAGWSGRAVTTARQRWERLLPLPCSRCGRPVEADQPWQVDHLQALAVGGGLDGRNQWPAHSGCNARHGTRVRAQLAGRVGRWRL